jgi:hypothetical protein
LVIFGHGCECLSEVTHARMTAPPLSLATAGDDEPLCADCVRVAGGLCHFHEKHVLPQLAEPWWTRLIGEPYVCTNDACEEHAKCGDVPGAPAPRAMCGCHNCGQKRWARARAAQEDEPSIAGVKAARRNDRKRSRAEDRLEGALKGKFTRSRPPRDRSASSAA